MDASSVESTDAGCGASAGPVDATGWQLHSILTSLAENPPPLPGWPPAQWRSALRRYGAAEDLIRSLFDARLRTILAWIASRTTPDRHLGAVAAVLAVLDAELTREDTDASMLMRRVHMATITAAPLNARRHSQARVAATASVGTWAAPSACSVARDESPFVSIATRLIHNAGCELEADGPLSVRLGAALDVAVDHWMSGAQPGGGLPPFRSEHPLRSSRRLAVVLGRDRDLLHLVYGPHPGRGRGLQTARRRGLAYWVAVTWRAERLAEAVPTIPAPVVFHWRAELHRLGVPLSATAAANTCDAPKGDGRSGDSYRIGGTPRALPFRRPTPTASAS
jgi:hypothetical protein